MNTSFQLLDPSGRNLIWIKFLAGVSWHTLQTAYDSDECKIVFCPRPSKDQVPDITSRPCHSEGNNFFRLKEEIHTSLLEMLGGEPRYQLEFRYANNEPEPGWHVGFLEKDKDKAMLFKLTWVT